MPVSILLAEDDLDDRGIFQDFLSHRTDIHLWPPVENGEEVLQVLKSGNQMPQVIILDQNMPRKNGLQTLHDLKSNAAYAGIRVVLYSTYADAALEDKGKAGGAAAIWSKPVTAEGYNEMIDAILVLQSVTD